MDNEFKDGGGDDHCYIEVELSTLEPTAWPDPEDDYDIHTVIEAYLHPDIIEARREQDRKEARNDAIYLFQVNDKPITDILDGIIEDIQGNKETDWLNRLLQLRDSLK
jgi:hypothetical protein